MDNPAGRDGTVVVAHGFDIDTRQEPVVFLRRDSDVARSEGFEAMSRVTVVGRERTIIATLVMVGPELLSPGHIGLSNAARRLLSADDGEQLHLSYPKPVESLAHVRSKVYGHELGFNELESIVADIVSGQYMDVHLAAFITACANGRMSQQEIISLTRAMVTTGQRLSWSASQVVDKHSVGGLPGNRTTPIIVAIITANGLVMPKTSSRAITSPSGTADTMETLAPVNLNLDDMRRVVEQEGGCIAWGGSVSLSPADDILIRVERALDVDSEGQLIASVLSKKIAAGSTDVVIDMPVGETAKVRSEIAATDLAGQLAAVGKALDINVEVVAADGQQPVGRGIGPALEARDVLAVLQNEASAPEDLRERATVLAGRLLEVAGKAQQGNGVALAQATLTDGAAWRKFQAICEAQGGMREPPHAHYRYDVFSDRAGVVERVDNRVIARIAKLAGAPADKSAGLEMSVRLGAQVRTGDVLMTVHAESPGELEYALGFQRENPGVIVAAPG